MKNWVGLGAMTLALCGVFGSGCGSDDSGGSGGSGGSGATGGSSGSGGSAGSSGSGTQLCTPGSGAVDLTGQWAVRADLNVQITGDPDSLVLLCPDPQTQPATLLLKVEITGSGTSYQQTVSVCEIGLPTVTGGVGSCPSDPSQALETEIKPGPALSAYLPTVTVPDVPVTLGAAEVRQAYNPSAFALVLGATLAAPATDPLPFWDTAKTGCGSAAADPQPADCVVDLTKVTDEDGDGDIGVTLEAHAVDSDGTTVIDGVAAAVLRVAPTLTGTITNDSCVTGTLAADFQYSIVDSDVTLTGAPINTPSVIEQLPPFEIQPDSTFRMLRANGSGDYDFDDDDDGTVTCTEIKNHGVAFSR
jgi:hypothetical protein